MTLPRYKIRILPQARMDLVNLYNHIAYGRFAPNTAEKYINGIIDTIYSLALTGGMFAVNDQDSLLQKYGSNVRTIIYKKMSIIYTVSDGVVIVRSVVPSSTIK